jgi:hypothetical protein
LIPKVIDLGIPEQVAGFDGETAGFFPYFKFLE